MFKLRQTWKNVLPEKKLYALDVRVNMLDPAWPITAQAPEQTTIHVNPKFLMQVKIIKNIKNRFVFLWKSKFYFLKFIPEVGLVEIPIASRHQIAMNSIL